MKDKKILQVVTNENQAKEIKEAAGEDNRSVSNFILNSTLQKIKGAKNAGQ